MDNKEQKRIAASFDALLAQLNNANALIAQHAGTIVTLKDELAETNRILIEKQQNEAKQSVKKTGKQ